MMILRRFFGELKLAITSTCINDSFIHITHAKDYRQKYDKERNI